MDFYASSISQLFRDFQTSKNGLTTEEATKRRTMHGANVLPPSHEATTQVRIFFDQFRSPLIIVLVLAGVVSALLGEMVDMVVIGITVCLNTLVGFFQENKANQALQKLRTMVEYHAVVLRDGHKHILPSDDIVPGDILFLDAGDKIQADGRILECVHFQVNEASLTGESVAVKKMQTTLKKDTPIADQKNMVFRGTVVVNGNAAALITATGPKTQIGGIASLVQETAEEKTPLQTQLHRLSQKIGIVVLFFSCIIFFLNIFFSNGLHSFFEAFQISVAIAVAAIPEGLAITLTVILAIGMRHILKRRSLVRKLVAAETLGSVNVICTDKTGTITEGIMRVTKIITMHDDLDFDEVKTLHVSKADRHEDALFALKIGVMTNDAMLETGDNDGNVPQFVGDTTDVAFLEAGRIVGIEKEQMESVFPRSGHIPFTSEQKYIATRHRADGALFIYVKGAPEVILGRCVSIQSKGKKQVMTDKKQQWIKDQIVSLTDQGLRVIAIAYKEEKTAGKELANSSVSELVFVGLAGLSDPIRLGVRETIEKAKKAGIRTIMITGDHVHTAQSIAASIGLPHGAEFVCDGLRLGQMSDDELTVVVEKVSVFARVDPVHKIRIVQTLQKNGNVVAMTGDGVNDAPALKAADIGVALGSGTDVAKEIADIVLLDDSYETIVASVEEGRGIYQNIKKVLLYLMSGSLAEVVLIGGSILAGLPLPVLPVQILWVNIIEDAFPAMALAFDKSEKENMKDRPRKRGESILDREMKIMIVVITLFSNFVLLGLFFYFVSTIDDIARIRTLMFVGLAIAPLLYIYAVRSRRRMLWQMNPFDNIFLNFSILFGWFLLIGAVYIPLFQTLLRTVPLSFSDWKILILFGFVNLFLIEIMKYLFLVSKKHTVSSLQAT
ncbi:MAG TPA: ATPase [Candidatus Magasanikbacteria bacterium]|nr:ATPase [Candidatus Magasanikbacteria bacterium]